MRSRGVLDIPNHRSSHVSPVPRGGGVACLTGAVLAALWAAAAGEGVTWWLVVPAVALSAVGLADDVQSLPVSARLAGQIAAGAVLGLAYGGWWIWAGVIAAPLRGPACGQVGRS